MNQKQPEPTKIALDELQSKYPLLDFLVKKEVKTISHEMEVSIKAGGIVGLIYDAFLKQYRILSTDIVFLHDGNIGSPYKGDEYRA